MMSCSSPLTVRNHLVVRDQEVDSHSMQLSRLVLSQAVGTTVPTGMTPEPLVLVAMVALSDAITGCCGCSSAILCPMAPSKPALTLQRSTTNVSENYDGSWGSEKKQKKKNE